MLSLVTACFHFRLVQNNMKYGLNIYWTRLQVGVRCKSSKRQVWATTTATAASSFEDKIRLANEVVSW